MRNKIFYRLLLFVPVCLILIPCLSYAQVADTSKASKTLAALDTATPPAKKIRLYSPRKAAIRSAIVPGLGQIYNRKYWKLPIVYGALGTTAGIFIFNLQWYRRTRYAYKAVVDTSTTPYPDIYPDLQFLVDRGDAQNLAYLRDQYRRDIDYSAVFFLIFWGLNVVDAAVDAHLKGFDVSPDLTLHVKPTLSQMAFSNGPALSFVFDIGKKKPALVRSRF